MTHAIGQDKGHFGQGGHQTYCRLPVPLSGAPRQCLSHSPHLQTLVTAHSKSTRNISSRQGESLSPVPSLTAPTHHINPAVATCGLTLHSLQGQASCSLSTSQFAWAGILQAQHFTVYKADLGPDFSSHPDEHLGATLLLGSAPACHQDIHSSPSPCPRPGDEETPGTPPTTLLKVEKVPTWSSGVQAGGGWPGSQDWAGVGALQMTF